MSKEAIKNNIAKKRIEIVSLRAKLVKVKDEKKAKMASLSKTIKSTSSKSVKESNRKQKISESTRFDKNVDSIKKKIEGVKKQMEYFKSSLARLK